MMVCGCCLAYLCCLIRYGPDSSGDDDEAYLWSEDSDASSYGLVGEALEVCFELVHSFV